MSDVFEEQDLDFNNKYGLSLSKFIIIEDIQTPKKIIIDNKIICPFEHTSQLSFAQHDIYLYELAWFLKSEFIDLFKEDWCKLKNILDRKQFQNLPKDVKVLPAELRWDLLDPNDLYKEGFDFELHFFALKLMPKIFIKIVNLINDKVTKHEIKKEINFTIDADLIHSYIKNDINEIFFIKEDYSSYVYDTEEKLYIYNNSIEKTLNILKIFLEPIKCNIQRLKFYISEYYNRYILDTLLNNINCRKVNKKILDIIKNRNNFRFNNSISDEIAYKDKIINLKSGEQIPRMHRHHYTTTIKATYLKNYKHVPKYIRSIFGDDKEELLSIQITLGSLISTPILDQIVLFYGEGNNSKKTFIHALSYIFQDFQLSISYENFINKKMNEILDLNQKRIVIIYDMNIYNFLEDYEKINSLISNRTYNLICVINKLPRNFDNFSIRRKLIKLNFPYTFINQPKSKNEKELIPDLKVNPDLLFTWLINGCILNFKNKKQIQIEKKSPLLLEANKEYVSDDDNFSDEDNFIIHSDEEEENKNIINFINMKTILSINEKINKQTLCDQFYKFYDIKTGTMELNKYIKKYFNFNEKKINDKEYWLGITLL